MYIYSIDGGRNQNYLHETKKKKEKQKWGRNSILSGKVQEASTADTSWLEWTKLLTKKKKKKW